MTPEMAKRREFVVRVALSVGASLLPWRLASGAPASGSDLVSPPSTKLLASLPDRMARGRVNSDVMVRARDGIGLATDVYLPDGPGPFPTVLTRLPYGKTEAYCAMPVVADLWNRRGYAAVVQDVRGKWGSEGVFEPNLARNEISDGHDTVDWIAKQPWSDGRVGMWGESYFGFTTWAAAVSQHPALVAIAPGDTANHRGAAVPRAHSDKARNRPLVYGLPCRGGSPCPGRSHQQRFQPLRPQSQYCRAFRAGGVARRRSPEHPAR